MKAIAVLAALISLPLCPSAVIAEALLEPCGTITQDTTLKSDCAAPLVVGADNVRIDLNGFTVEGDPSHDDSAQYRGNIEIIDRHDVTLTNGKVERFWFSGVLVRGGRANRIENVWLSGNDETWRVGRQGVALLETRDNVIQNVQIKGARIAGVHLRDSHENLLNRLTTVGEVGYYGVAIASGDGNHLRQSRLRASDIGAYVEFGTGNVIERNEIRCVFNFIRPLRGVNVYPNGSRTAIKSNTITACDAGVYIQGSSNKIEGNRILASGSVGIQIDWSPSLANIIRFNKVRSSGDFDMADYNPDCGTNKWEQNSFTTDLEGDGEDAGCIQ